jgi:hypothetical protein
MRPEQASITKGASGHLAEASEPEGAAIWTIPKSRK